MTGTVMGHPRERQEFPAEAATRWQGAGGADLRDVRGGEEGTPPHLSSEPEHGVTASPEQDPGAGGSPGRPS